MVGNINSLVIIWKTGYHCIQIQHALCNVNNKYCYTQNLFSILQIVKHGVPQGSILGPLLSNFEQLKKLLENYLLNLSLYSFDEFLGSGARFIIKLLLVTITFHKL